MLTVGLVLYTFFVYFFGKADLNILTQKYLNLSISTYK